jgi:hypothetical protein
MAIHCTIHLKCYFIRENFTHERLILVYLVSKPLRKLYYSIRIIFIHDMKQYLDANFPFSTFQMRCTFDLLISVSREHCFVKFCGDRVNCSSTIAEERDSLCKASEIFACVHHTLYHRAKILLRMREIVNRVGCSVANSRSHYHCTSHTFSNFQYYFKIILRCSKYNRSVTILDHSPAIQ